MATKVVDERKLVEAGFILMARNVGWSRVSVWRRDDELDLTWNDEEAMAWLAEREAKGKKK